MPRLGLALGALNLFAAALMIGAAGLHVRSDTIEYRYLLRMVGQGTGNGARPPVRHQTDPGAKHASATATGNLVAAQLASFPLDKRVNGQERRMLSGPLFLTADEPVPTVDGVNDYPEPPDRAVIAEVQALLAARHYDPGVVDGIHGPRTRKAISAFEIDQGWQPTGEIHRKLLLALRDGGEAGGDPVRLAR